MIYNIIIIILIFIASALIVKKDKEEFKKYKIIVFCFFAIGFALRLVNIANFPNALNVDEASSGYEAYSIGNYGIDRNGNFIPVFLKAWGSGQNALYTYILIPFVKILGLNILSTRLPMAIVGCISLIIMYKILQKLKSPKLALIGLIFFVICPWHIMKSRWGLESNLFPELVLWAVYLLIIFLEKKNIKYLYCSSIILGLSTYSYVTSYFFLPIFCAILLAVFLKKKIINIKQGIITLGIIFAISLPIIMCLIINFLDLPQLNGLITIPKFDITRDSNLVSFSFMKYISNFIEAIKIFFIQVDGLGWNSYKIYGTIYVISLPFTVIGIVRSISKKENINLIFNIWFISSLLILPFYEPNINRMNIIMIPIVFYTILGIDFITNKFIISKFIIGGIYLILFVGLIEKYYKTNWNNYYTFNSEAENVIRYVDKLDVDIINFDYSFKEPYIYILFYTKQNPNDFVKTVEYNENVAFERVKAFGKYKFYNIKEIKQTEQKDVYVIPKYTEKDFEIDENIWQKEYIDNFIVLEEKI